MIHPTVHSCIPFPLSTAIGGIMLSSHQPSLHPKIGDCRKQLRRSIVCMDNIIILNELTQLKDIA